MIFLVVENSICSVYLLSYDQPDELMGKCKGGKGKLLLCSLQYRGIDPKSPANEDDKLPCTCIRALLQEVRQLVRGHGFTPFIKRQQIILRLQHIQDKLAFLFFQFRDRKAGRLLHRRDQFYVKISIML